MQDNELDLHGEMLLAEYQKKLPIYEELNRVISEKIKNEIKECGIEINVYESRVKGEKSLIGKLQRKGHKYQSMADITDIVGARIITYYNEDVDRIASIAEKLFIIDWENSVDKRKTHQRESFGYNSLHYICRIPPEFYYDSTLPELNEIPFELQMRTALQHVWSAIQHDIGYKTDVETPDEHHRNLSRLAGLLELADNEFSRIRNAIADYRRRATFLVENGQLAEAMLDGDTFHTYLNQDPFGELNRRIAGITAAELHETSLMPYLGVLKAFGLQTLADVDKLIKENEEDAYQLALFQIGSTDIDILASSIGIQNLCIVYTLKQGNGKKGVTDIFQAINGESPNNELMASIIMEQASRLSFMQNIK
ncbi:MAG: hypothetical protein IJ081_04135 [Prevotella sp.]|jgi:ppGpp synthetase/RelA/SpoT-type nucleotidyltranferase|nr:hypothetical protein [Prevotella sp.]